MWTSSNVGKQTDDEIQKGGCVAATDGRNLEGLWPIAAPGKGASPGHSLMARIGG